MNHNPPKRNAYIFISEDLKSSAGILKFVDKTLKYINTTGIIINFHKVTPLNKEKIKSYGIKKIPTLAFADDISTKNTSSYIISENDIVNYLVNTIRVFNKNRQQQRINSIPTVPESIQDYMHNLAFIKDKDEEEYDDNFNEDIQKKIQERTNYLKEKQSQYIKPNNNTNTQEFPNNVKIDTSPTIKPNKSVNESKYIYEKVKQGGLNDAQSEDDVKDLQLILSNMDNQEQTIPDYASWDINMSNELF